MREMKEAFELSSVPWQIVVLSEALLMSKCQLKKDTERCIFVPSDV